MTVKIRVPIPLLLTPSLLATTRLGWIGLYLDSITSKPTPTTPKQLAELLSISRPTITRALSQLTDYGLYLSPNIIHPNEAWYNTYAPTTIPSSTWAQLASMPATLICAGNIAPQSRLLYGVLQATHDYGHLKGQFTYRQLNYITQLDPKTVRRAIHNLSNAGWLRIEPGKHNEIMNFSLRDPITSMGHAKLLVARHRLKKSTYFGEALMKELLSLLIDSDEYEDNAMPAWLVNPYTSERMELDRYYPALDIAFEFQGIQHYAPTEFSTPDEVAKQQARDAIKSALCTNRGVSLFLIHPNDLSISDVRDKIGNHAPLRDLRYDSLLIDDLEAKCLFYRRKAQQNQSPQP